MIAQAAHIPVHLGAMPESVRAVLRSAVREPGDVFLLNDPYHGGSHLPDLTLVEAIGHRRRDRRVRGGARAPCRRRRHEPGQHAAGRDGARAGRAHRPARSSRARGRARRGAARRSSSPTCARRTSGEATSRAQLAACAAGRVGWRALAARLGAARSTPRATRCSITPTARARPLAPLGARAGNATDRLEGDGVTDDDIECRRRVRRVGDGTLHLDFTGSSPQVAGNVNCPAAVTRAAAVFALRTLLDDDVPTNDGIARAIALVLPERSAVNARGPPRSPQAMSRCRSALPIRFFAALGDAGVDVAGAGAGHDEQRHVRWCRMDVLRDARRRSGRELARTGSERACTSA